MKQNLDSSLDKQVKLIMAGGYDNRVAENRDHHDELISLANELKLDLESGDVTFLKSPSDSEKLRLLRTSNALLYTPSGYLKFLITMLWVDVYI